MRSLGENRYRAAAMRFTASPLGLGRRNGVFQAKLEPLMAGRHRSRMAAEAICCGPLIIIRRASRRVLTKVNLRHRDFPWDGGYNRDRKSTRLNSSHANISYA